MIFKRRRKEEQNIINCANLQYRKAVNTADLYMKSKEYREYDNRLYWWSRNLCCFLYKFRSIIIN